MKYLFLITLALFTLTGCGGGSSDTASTPDNEETNMIIDQPYTIEQGDKIIKTSTPTLIEIKHTEGQSTSTVILLEGSAIIIHKL